MTNTETYEQTSQPSEQNLLTCMNTVIAAIDIAGSMPLSAIERALPYKDVPASYLVPMLAAMEEAGLIKLRDGAALLTPTGRVRADKLALLRERR